MASKKRLTCASIFNNDISIVRISTGKRFIHSFEEKRWNSFFDKGLQDPVFFPKHKNLSIKIFKNLKIRVLTGYRAP